MTDPSDALIDFALFALDHATGSVVDSGGPLVPFVLVETDGKRALHRFMAPTLEGGVAQARAFIGRAEGADRVLVAWDGYLTAEGRRMDAVFVEASETTDPHSVVMAQRYAAKGLLRKKVSAFGNAALVARGESALG